MPRMHYRNVICSRQVLLKNEGDLLPLQLSASASAGAPLKIALVGPHLNSTADLLSSHGCLLRGIYMQSKSFNLPLFWIYMLQIHSYLYPEQVCRREQACSSKHHRSSVSTARGCLR